MVHQDIYRRQGIASSDVISQLRFPLIVLVTYAHSYGKVSDDYMLLSSPWDTYEVLKLLVSQTLVKIAVPAFFVISGYLFFKNIESWNFQVYQQKMLRRVKTLLLPYLLWNLLMAVKLRTFNWNMFWVFNPMAGMQTDWLGCENWMTAPANMPLWFLRDLIVVSMFTPIVYIVLRRWGNCVMLLLTLLYLSGIGAFAVPGLSMYAVYFFCLGAFFGIRKLDIVEAMRHFETPAYIMFVMLGIVMMFTYHTVVFSSFMLVFRLVSVVVVFSFGHRILSKTDRRIPGMICRSSYFIYLSHYVIFLSFLDSAFFHLAGTSGLGMSLHYLICPVVKIIVLVGTYIVLLHILNKIMQISD